LFENRLLRKLFAPKKEEVAGDWRRLHKEELQVKEDEQNVACNIHGRDEYAYNILSGKP
jgi:hypothetical protein